MQVVETRLAVPEPVQEGEQCTRQCSKGIVYSAVGNTQGLKFSWVQGHWPIVKFSRVLITKDH